MGFYPSFNTAKKIQTKAKSICKEVKIIKEKDCFVVVLAEKGTYEEADELFSKYMSKKLFCGVQAIE